MKRVQEYQIIQRNADGYGQVPFAGTLENDRPEGTWVYARAAREDDNLIVIPWTKCDCQGRDWSITLTLPEGGLYRLEAAVGQGGMGWVDLVDVVYHVGVGDIFITTGQSNMTGYGRDNAYDPVTLGVHALCNNGKWGLATQPLSMGIGNVFGFAETACGTSPALSFARTLHRYLGVPIGILPTAVGGTPLTKWMPDGEGSCFQWMGNRIAVTGDFKGYIWFQGCSDANENDAPTYFDRFASMLKQWDEIYGHHPIITVQLNRWCGTDSHSEDPYWGMIRDAQRRAALELPDVYTVPSLDLPVTDGIHNSSGANVIIGERMANTALANLYGKPGQTAPNVLGVEKKDDTHVLVRLTPGHQVYAMDNKALGMNVEDAQGLVDCVQAIPVADGFLVDTTRPFTLPAKFHYAWRAQPPVFVARDFNDQPLLACYGVEIQENTEEK